MAFLNVLLIARLNNISKKLSITTFMSAMETRNATDLVGICCRVRTPHDCH